MMYYDSLMTHALKNLLLTPGGRSGSTLLTDYPPSPLSTRRGMLDINLHRWHELQMATRKST